MLQTPIPAAAVRDTISRIVLERGYREDVTSTLLSRAWDWIRRVLGDLFDQATNSRGTYLISLTLIGLAITISVARAVIVARARRQAASRREIPVTAAEQLAQARGLAAQGAFVDAAHLLHATIVTSLVEQKRVRRHPSKTVGDYGRDLREAGDALATPYQAFAQVYDIVAYGDGLCDASRYARLETLAAPLVSSPAPQVPQRAA
ncbi:MAG: DUF4129 domain-containing protein [Gemmatimonadaceae bacterium]|nr:DUF4129 domain-containing protein [Gemmatimonadaceae bacterium]